MREVDRLTAERGIPNLILMENAGHRVIEFMERRWENLSKQRVVVFCGKGNNGGDGLVVARQLFTRIHPAELHVVVAAPDEMTGDAGENLRMLRACGCPYETVVRPEMRSATIVVDALLGTGLTGPPRGRALEFIREINNGFPLGEALAVDIPSGLESDQTDTSGEFVHADCTVTFTAPKIAHALPPNCDRMGQLHVAPIGSPVELLEGAMLSLIEPGMFSHLLANRLRDGHKGLYGHVLVLAGSPGKTGAAAMTGVAVLRAGAGLCTVASSAEAIPIIASFAPELMTQAFDDFSGLPLDRKDVMAVGPGLGTQPKTVELVRRLFAEVQLPMVIDADGLNALAGTDFRGSGPLRVLTPHPGEMERLAGSKGNRLETAQRFAKERNVTVVLKGHRTIIGFPDGRAWINPTGSPALATGGTGDVLTGMIAGMLGQYPEEPDLAIAIAVYLHGRSGELGAEEIGEQPFLATDIFSYLPEALRECANVPDRV
jgi:NAD(P)H-hydrate epimerase